MGRREKPLLDASTPQGEFCGGLRDVRRAAGSPTYETLAGVSEYSDTALSSAASGRTLPTWELAEAYLTACNLISQRNLAVTVADVTEWRTRWISAIVAAAGITRLPDPTLVTTPEQLAAELTALALLSGFTTRRSLATASNGALSKTTVNRVLGDQQVPTKDVLLGILHVCGVPATGEQPWIDARQRAERRGAVNVVSITPSHSVRAEGPAGHPERLIADLSRDVRLLARGRGLANPHLLRHVGPQLRQVCRIADDEPPHIARVKLVDALTEAVTPLPRDLNLIARAAFALGEDNRERFLQGRLRRCSAELDRDPRTIRRWLDEATHLIAERLLLHHDAAAAEKPPQLDPLATRTEGNP